jgi:hypothetical protein
MISSDAPALGQPFNPYRRFHGAWIPEPVLRSDLPHAAKLCYAQLAWHAGEHGRCFPSQATLAAELHVSERQVRRYLRDLGRRGYIRIRRRGLNQPNAYVFLWHESFDGAKPLIPQDRTSMSDPDRTHMAVLDRTDVADKEIQLREETPYRSIDTGGSPLSRPTRRRHPHRHALEQWPVEDIEVIRKHLQSIPCQDGKRLTPTDELVAKLLNACKLYMRTSYELASLLYRVERRIRRRPSWRPERADSAAAWLLAVVDQEYAPEFLTAEKKSAAIAASAYSKDFPDNPDPEIESLIYRVAEKKRFPTK